MRYSPPRCMPRFSHNKLTIFEVVVKDTDQGPKWSSWRLSFAWKSRPVGQGTSHVHQFQTAFSALVQVMPSPSLACTVSVKALLFLSVCESFITPGVDIIFLAPRSNISVPSFHSCPPNVFLYKRLARQRRTFRNLSILVISQLLRRRQKKVSERRRRAARLVQGLPEVV